MLQTNTNNKSKIDPNAEPKIDSNAETNLVSKFDKRKYLNKNDLSELVVGKI
jgi:hypothetical protein